MDVSRITRVPSVLGSGVIALVLLPLTLTGCGPHPVSSVDPASSGADSAAAADVDSVTTSETAGADTDLGGGAVFRIGDESFEFSPTSCMVTEEDILVQGPGVNAKTGEIAFLDVDFTSFNGDFAGGADIELGTDRPFTSADDFYRLDPLFDGEGFALTIDGRSFQANGAFHRHGPESSGGDSAGSGVLTVQCDGA